MESNVFRVRVGLLRCLHTLNSIVRSNETVSTIVNFSLFATCPCIDQLSSCLSTLTARLSLSTLLLAAIAGLVGAWVNMSCANNNLHARIPSSYLRLSTGCNLLVIPRSIGLIITMGCYSVCSSRLAFHLIIDLS